MFCKPVGNHLESMKKIFRVVLIVGTILTIIAILAGNEEIIIYSASTMLILFGVETVRCWFSGEAIGIRSPLEIPANASKPIRLIGLIYAFFLFGIGVAMLI
jgi:hypothetical protein